jgi:hypothetical protein
MEMADSRLSFFGALYQTLLGKAPTTPQLSESQKRQLEAVENLTTIHVDTNLGDGDEDEIWTNISYLKNKPATAYSKPLADLKFDEKKNLSQSSHKIYMGKDKEGNTHFIKEIDTKEMMYVEAFLGHLYSLSFLYGTARGIVRDNEAGEPVFVSSKGLPGFMTFKEEALSERHLANPIYRKRFLRFLAIPRRLKEDDAHRGNATQFSFKTEEEGNPNIQATLETALCWFDSDCGEWAVTWKIKGPRKGVDGIIRNPKECFKLRQKNDVEGDDGIKHAPNYKHGGGWYYPGQENLISSYVTTNPWTPEEVALVQQLESEEAMHTFFEEDIDWMLDLSIRYPHIAALNIPANMTIPNSNKTIIEKYCKLDKKTDAEYWDILPRMPEFKDYLEKNSSQILTTILTRTLVRNARLEKEAKEADPSFAKLFADARVHPSIIIKNFQMLIDACQKKDVLAFTIPPEVSFFQPSAEKNYGRVANASYENEFANAKKMAELMIAKENKIGTTNWTAFLPEKIIQELNQTVTSELPLRKTFSR